MRILQMVRTLDPSSGGVVRAVLLLSEGLTRQGHEVEIASLDPESVSFPAPEKMLLHRLGVSTKGYGYSAALGSWLRENAARFDRVIVHGMWQYPGRAAWRQFAGSSTPYYVFPHGMLDPWFKRTYPLKHLKKWLYWPWAEYRVLRDARAVIFTAEEERLQARESFWLYRCTERVASLGVETAASDSAESFLTKFPQLRGKQFLLFLGRIHPKKGCDLLMEALAQMPNETFHLVLAGPDQVGWQERLQARAEAAGTGARVVFTGMLEGEMKSGALAAADAFILPSHQENFALAAAEALAAGVPVLLSRRVNIWREIEEDGAGFAEEDDAAGTKRLMERWTELPEAERAAMRLRAKECFARRFNLESATKSLVRILEEEF